MNDANAVKTYQSDSKNNLVASTSDTGIRLSPVQLIKFSLSNVYDETTFDGNIFHTPTTQLEQQKSYATQARRE